MLKTLPIIVITMILISLISCDQNDSFIHHDAMLSNDMAHNMNDDMTSDMTLDEIIIPLPNPTCVGYFGNPNERSGLNAQMCNTSCVCEEGQSPLTLLMNSPVFNFQAMNEPPPLVDDPYLSSEPPPSLQGVACVIELDEMNQTYRLETRLYSEASPSMITHLGPCGACSSMRDLKVYLENIDLTEPVRSCGLKGLTQGQEESVNCLRDIGFSEPCAMIWYFNTLNTRTQCLDVCLSQLNASYVNEQGELNPCLACDEEKSGAIFKAYAGRTRRNSGIPSAICRPCNSVSPISHNYLENSF